MRHFSATSPYHFKIIALLVAKQLFHDLDKNGIQKLASAALSPNR